MQIAWNWSSCLSKFLKKPLLLNKIDLTNFVQAWNIYLSPFSWLSWMNDRRLNDVLKNPGLHTTLNSAVIENSGMVISFVSKPMTWNWTIQTIVLQQNFNQVKANKGLFSLNLYTIDSSILHILSRSLPWQQIIITIFYSKKLPVKLVLRLPNWNRQKLLKI